MTFLPKESNLFGIHGCLAHLQVFLEESTHLHTTIIHGISGFQEVSEFGEETNFVRSRTMDVMFWFGFGHDCSIIAIIINVIVNSFAKVIRLTIPILKFHLLNLNLIIIIVVKQG